MDAVAVLGVLALVAVVVLVVGSPFRRGHAEAQEATHVALLEELEAEKTAKYREIRDAELDHRTGKLDEADWRAVDRTLRAEAVAILRRIDELGATTAGPGADR